MHFTIFPQCRVKVHIFLLDTKSPSDIPLRYENPAKTADV